MKSFGLIFVLSVVFFANCKADDLHCDPYELMGWPNIKEAVKNNILFANPCDCRSFFQFQATVDVNNFITTRKTCPEGLVFTQKTQCQHSHLIPYSYIEDNGIQCDLARDQFKAE